MTARARWTGLAAFLALWQGLAMLAGGWLLAGPAEVLAWLAAHAGLMVRATGVTLANAAWGFALGNLAAILLAAVPALWPRTLTLVAGLALVVFCLPLIATGPILRVLMGPGNGPQIVLAGLAVYYTTLIPLLAGLRAMPSAWLDLVRSYGRGRWTELVHLRARASLPYLLAGLRTAAPASVLGAMVGEFTGAERGLGVLTIRFTRDLDVPALWSVAAVAAGLAIAVHAAVGWLGRRLLPDAPPVILALIWGPDAALTRSRLLAAMGQTLALAVPGYLAGLALGAGLAVLLAVRPGLSALMTPLAVSLRSIPIVTTAPLIVLLLGRGAAGTVTLVALMVFFPTFAACQQGLRQAPGPILDLFRSYRAGRLRQTWHVRIPAMLPALFASARMGVPAAVLAATVVEWLATGRGLGNLMALSASVSDYAMLWLTMAAVTGMSALLYGAVAGAETRVLAVMAPEQVRA